MFKWLFGRKKANQANVELKQRMTQKTEAMNQKQKVLELRRLRNSCYYSPTRNPIYGDTMFDDMMMLYVLMEMPSIVSYEEAGFYIYETEYQNTIVPEDTQEYYTSKSSPEDYIQEDIGHVDGNDNNWGGTTDRDSFGSDFGSGSTFGESDSSSTFGESDSCSMD